jgi:hypothetical protein
MPPAPVVELASAGRPDGRSVPLALLLLVGVVAVIGGGAVRLLTSGRLPWRR